MKRIEGPAYALAIGFWLLSSVYALLASQPFAYEQFLKPELFAPLAGFARWHAWINLAVFALTLAVRRPALQASGRGACIALLGIWAVVSLALLVLPPLAELSPGSLTPLVTWLALAPVALLVWAEWSSAPAPARSTAAAVAPPRTSDDFWACVAAGCVATLIYAAVAHFTGLERVAAPPLDRAAGFAQSLLLHQLLFLATFCGLTLVRGLARLFSGAPHAAELALAAAGLAALLNLLLGSIVMPGLSFAGPAASAIGAALAVTLALAIAVRGVAQSDASCDAVARVLRPLVPAAVGRSRAAAGLWLGVLAAAAAGLAAVTAQLDFNHIVSRTSVITLWLLLLATCMRSVRPRVDRSPALLYGAAACVLAAHVALGSAAAAAQFARTGIDLAQARSSSLARDPSFRLLHAMLEPPANTAVAIFALLRDHTNISRKLEVDPVELSLAPLEIAPAKFRPHIFLFVVDSLRRDYVSAYNPAATFTPEIGRFAADSTVFRHAFTRYGATGLSVPALWVGAPVLHKQYITPFAPMNTLHKLLEHEGYAQWVGMDNILDVILPPTEARVPLDAEGAEKDFSFCGKLGELERRLAARERGAPPVFAYTLPQDIHVSVVAREGGQSIDGEAYPGFSAPVASRVRRFDACFGNFIDTLRRLNLYDDSLIVLTSDHGDSLGEEGRVGHAYGLFPEVIRIPLIVSLPARMRARLEADTAAPVYNTDVTPTLYEVLGHARSPSSPLFGHSLFAAAGQTSAPDEGVMVASSYGAVYGALLDSATQLYIIDTVNVREYAYALAPELEGEAIPVDASLRRRGQATIRKTIQALADLHGYQPEP